MSTLADRIAQFQKMTENVPDDELGHFRLGQLLAEDGQLEGAAASFERTLELMPTFSKVYQLLGETRLKLGQKEQAVEVLTAGWTMADSRGDKLPRDAMGQLLTQNGAAVPAPAPVIDEPEDDGVDTGFRCERPGCPFGKRAQRLTKPPLADAIGVRVMEQICAGCWESWKKDFSIKVINETRIDLSTESGTAEYDRHLRNYFGFDDEPAAAEA